MIYGKELYISDLLIKKDRRGRGIGTKLLSEIERIAKKSGVKRIMLNNNKNEESYKSNFYKKHNFIERENISNFIKYL